MNVKDALLSRRSCRAFKSEPVDKELIKDIIEASLRSPSWANSQPWEIFVATGEPLEKIRKVFIESSEKGTKMSPHIPAPVNWTDSINTRRRYHLEQLKLMTGEAVKEFGPLNKKLFNAPAIIYLCMDNSLTTWSIFDLGIISQSIMLAAIEKGLSTMPAVAFVNYPDILHKELNIPTNYSIVFGIGIGYMDTEHQINNFISPRKTLEDTVTFIGF